MKKIMGYKENLFANGAFVARLSVAEVHGWELVEFPLRKAGWAVLCGETLGGWKFCR
jgi:hypothetical protein